MMIVDCTVESRENPFRQVDLKVEALVLTHTPGFQSAVGKDVLSWAKRVRAGFWVMLGNRASFWMDKGSMD